MKVSYRVYGESEVRVVTDMNGEEAEAIRQMCAGLIEVGVWPSHKSPVIEVLSIEGPCSDCGSGEASVEAEDWSLQCRECAAAEHACECHSLYAAESGLALEQLRDWQAEMNGGW